jgi:ATP adenylyltransferase
LGVNLAKAKKKKNSTKKVKAKKQDWPLKRNIFFRPDRMKYVRKLLKDEGCVFCTSAQSKKSFQSLCVYKSEHSQIVLNKYPYNSGHVLVLPLKHCGDILLLSDKEYMDLQITIRLAVKAVQTIYQPNGFNLGLNHGASSGAGIPEHLHYHIVPRWLGDVNFFPMIADTKVVVETVEQTYEKFENYFKSQKVGV